MILIQQTYSSVNPDRQAELDLVRSRNESCPAFTEIVAVPGTDKRHTFHDLFAIADTRYAGQPCVVANSDIAFDESLHDVFSLLRPGMLVALTRWDDCAAPSMEGRVDQQTWKFFSHSQDTWVFIGGSLPRFAADFQLGIPRCENRLAYEAAAAGVVVMNPALSIRTWHHHATNVRTWKPKQYYRGSLFFPQLTTIDPGLAQGFIISKARPRKEMVVALDGTADGFRRQIMPDAAASAGFAHRLIRSILARPGCR